MSVFTPDLEHQAQEADSSERAETVYSNPLFTLIFISFAFPRPQTGSEHK
jgi:hypothetical protein